VTQPDLTLTW